MIPFQINSNSRADMREFLIKYFKFQDYCDSLKERFPAIESTKFRRLSTHNASSSTYLFKSLLRDIKEFLSGNFDNRYSLFSIGTKIFEMYDESIEDAFFWDTIIALYLQLAYDNSERTTMRSFYNDNLKKCNIKYDSYTDYFKKYIYDHPMGEYLNIHADNLDKPHSRRYIMDCFPVQQYVLIHSFSKSPYYEFTNSSDTVNPFKMREYVQALELADFHSDSQIYRFEETVQRICAKVYKGILETDKSHFTYRDPKEQQMERQLTAYIVEQAYSYELYAQIASAVSGYDSFKHLLSRDKTLYKKISKLIETQKNILMFAGLKPREILAHLPEFEEEISTYTQEANDFLYRLISVANIVCVSSVLTRPYIVSYLLHRKGPYSLLVNRNEFGGYTYESPGNECIPLSIVYIPVVQEFFLQTLLWLFPMPDSKIPLDRFLRQLLIENLDKWEYGIGTVKKLTPLERKLFGLLFELSRNRFRSVDTIRSERSLLDFSRFMKDSQNTQSN